MTTRMLVLSPFTWEQRSVQIGDEIETDDAVAIDMMIRSGAARMKFSPVAIGDADMRGMSGEEMAASDPDAPELPTPPPRDDRPDGVVGRRLRSWKDQQAR